MDRIGSILVAGSLGRGIHRDLAIWRFNADGSADRAFGSDGAVRFNEERRGH